MKSLLGKIFSPFYCPHYVFVLCAAFTVFAGLLAWIVYYIMERCQELNYNREFKFTLLGFVILLVLLNSLTAHIAHKTGKNSNEKKV